jgi:hypothetical protein
MKLMRLAAQRTFILCIVTAVLIVALAGGQAFGAVAGVQVADTGFSGNLRYISVTNNSSETVTITVQGSATLTNGNPETASTDSFSVMAGQTVGVVIPYSMPLATITDDLDPFESVL